MAVSKNEIQTKVPVKIAGAGPAGLAAAITLAHSGRQVIVYETQKEVGHRFGEIFKVWKTGPQKKMC